MKFYKLAAACALAFGSMSFAGGAFAATSYCSDPGGNTDGLTTGGMTFNGNNATDCYGKGEFANNSPATVESTINTLKWGDDWQFLVRDEGSGGTGTYMGLQFTLDANEIGNKSGTYTLNVVDTNGGAPLNLPTTLDFVGVLKGGTGFAAYFFDDVLVMANNNGTWTIQFKHKKNYPDLSHMDFLVRGGDGTNVPEPASAALFGIGMIGLAAMRRRRQQKS